MMFVHKLYPQSGLGDALCWLNLELKWLQTWWPARNVIAKYSCTVFFFISLCFILADFKINEWILKNEYGSNNVTVLKIHVVNGTFEEGMVTPKIAAKPLSTYIHTKEYSNLKLSNDEIHVPVPQSLGTSVSNTNSEL